LTRTNSVRRAPASALAASQAAALSRRSAWYGAQPDSPV